jgi:hypothetical protein
MTEVLSLLLLAVLICAGAAAEATSGNDRCTGSALPALPIDPAKPAVEARFGKTGLLMGAGAGPTPEIRVLHVWGTPYEWGLAHGTLLGVEIRAMLPGFQKWVDRNADGEFPKWLPEWFVALVEKFGLEAGLDMTYLLCEEYISQEFKDEIRGLAEGAKLPYMEMARVHMLPELIKASCTLMGAWGEATAHCSPKAGALYQLRALDWSTDGPFQQNPLLLVYHPETGNGHNFSIATWAGFVGAITGFSSAPVGMGMKVWLTYNGSSSRSGVPFHFLLRDVLQYDADTSAAMNRIYNARRTCSIFVGLGDATNRFALVEYSHDYVKEFDNGNFPWYEPHVYQKDVLYFDKHTQPSHHPCMPALMKKHYGRYDAATTLRYITPVVQTGNMLLAFYEYADMKLYLSNASPGNATGGDVVPAYNRPAVVFDMTTEFNRSP